MHQHNQLAVICRETAVVVHHFTSCHNLSSRSCRVWKGGSWSRVSLRTLCSHGNPATRTSFIAIPNIVFFPNPGSLCPNFCESLFPGSSQIPYPINVANPALCFVKFGSVSRLTFPVSRTVFWSNPVSHLTFPESRTVFCLNRGSREDPFKPRSIRRLTKIWNFTVSYIPTEDVVYRILGAVLVICYDVPR